tara:strand:- start:61 stop:174 length:114 start_codon:yes stop_codon:yes gene_type:complete
MKAHHKTNLDQLEAESIFIIREVFAEAKMINSPFINQ